MATQREPFKREPFCNDCHAPQVCDFRPFCNDCHAPQGVVLLCDFHAAAPEMVALLHELSEAYPGSPRFAKACYDGTLRALLARIEGGA